MPRRRSDENPFRYGGIARGTYFTDRTVELTRLRDDMRSGQNVVVISPRRYGKTSLVQRAIDELRAEDVLVAYVDLFGSPTRELLADHLAQALYEGLVDPVERALDKVLGFFAHLPIAPRLTVTEDARPALEFTSFERHEDVQKALEGLLAMPGRIAADRGRRVVLVIDEFQEVVSIDPHLPALMRAIFQAQDEVSHVFLGSKRHLMQKLFMDRGRHLYRAAKPLPLGPIGPADFAPFLRERFQAGGIPVDDAAIDHVLALTGGRPYETQELCSFAWSRARGEGAPVSVELVGRTLGDLIGAESARYTAVWDALSAHQRALLVALARETGEIYSERYRRSHKLGSPGSVRSSLRRLIERELVDRNAGYAISDVFLGEWVRRLD